MIFIRCVYISPSAQEFNEYLNGNSEEYYMNLVADRLTELLSDAGICYTRNSPSMNVNEIIRDSNSGDYALHLAIHSNAAPDSLSGKIRGTDVYYYPTSKKGKLLADIIVDNFKTISPTPNRVQTRPTTTLGEVKRTKAPAVLIEVAYHDNPEDEAFIKNNIDQIAEVLFNSILEYLDQTGNSESSIDATVVTMGGNLNLRDAPSLEGNIIDKMPNLSKIKVLGSVGNWYRVDFDGKKGYASRNYITIS